MRIALPVLLLTPAVILAGAQASARQHNGTPPRSSSAAPLTAASEHFVIRSYPGGPAASELLRACEEFRETFQTMWMGRVSSAWRPRCEVVVHASRARYQQAVGRRSGQTSGSSYIRFDRGRVAARRVDLLADGEGRVAALSHELSHVALADRFPGRQPPRWVDEGVATLADSWEKQRLHHRDCQYALHADTAIPLSELLRLEQCSSYEQTAAFYGQSLSLVGYLVQCETPKRFLALVELAHEKGIDHALRETYGIDNLALLERRWRAHVLAATSSPAEPTNESTIQPRLTAFDRARQ